MHKLFFIFAAVVLFSCNQKNDAGSAFPLFNKDSLAQQVKILSSDSFLGRKPFTEGEKITVEYLKNEFARIGLEPGNGSSYFQDVPLVEITADAAPVMKVQSPKGNFNLKKTGDFVIGTDNTDSIVSLRDDEVVFAGYGVVAPEYNWNDYAGIDVKGKVVLVLVNDPGFGVDTTLFKGRLMTYYGRWTYKYEEAARQGAKGCIIIHSTDAASYPFSVVQNSWSGARLLLDNRGSTPSPLLVKGWVTSSAGQKLLAAAGKDSSLIVSANKIGFKPVPLGIKLSVSMDVKAKYNVSQNVIGKITGSKRPGEYVIYTAHWDHYGIGKPDDKGDSIYNGAVDNASGTAALIEIAKAFKNLKEKPERTVLFLSVTAEEQGLLGSQYYAEHPLYPLDKTAGNINMDVINVNEKTNDIVIAGSGQNELEDEVIAIAKTQGRYLADEAHPEAGHYYRSDHFNFAKKGVPALSFSSGTDVVGKGTAYGKKLEDNYVTNNYHRPSDEYNAAWTFAGGLQDMELYFLLGKKLAGSEAWPQWKTGSEFKIIRGKK